MSNAPGVPLRIRRSRISKQGVGNLTAGDTNREERVTAKPTDRPPTLDAVFGDICEDAERVVVGL
jgi:hypothetical protein